jgi:coenzyme F420-0:L-glutamate ligase/coenzyme F420-1:gamma-L-glutamate ligase
VDKKILKLITSARIGHLTTASSNLQPYVTPVVFILQQNNIFVPLDDKPKTISVKELKRVKNIEENPKVSFLVDHYEEDWTNLWFVMIIGCATLVEMNGRTEKLRKEIKKIHTKFLKKDTQYTKLSIGRIYIKIKIDKTICWKYNQIK